MKSTRSVVLFVYCLVQSVGWRWLSAGLLVASVAPQMAPDQGRVTVSGTIKDTKTGEDFTGASIRIVELSGTGTAVNAYGFYTLTLPAGTYTLEANFVGWAA